MTAYAESHNLTDLELLDADYDRLAELAALRERAKAAGRDLLVRHVSTTGAIGYVYGLTIPGDWPAWRGTLEAIDAELDSPEAPRVKVADLNNRSSVQPQRVKVAEVVGRLLDEAPRKESSQIPQGFTHFELARAAYGVDEPTAAQLSAVRRVVARLVAEGRVVRDEDRMGTRLDHPSSGWHRRDYAEYSGMAMNPGGVVVRRTMTADDREARASFAEAQGYADYAERLRKGEAS